MSWLNTTLGNVITLKRGHDLPDSMRQDGDIPIVSSSGITGYHNKAKAQFPGVVTGRYGTIGKVFYLAEDYWPLNTSLYVMDYKGNNPRFVAYFLQRILKNYQSDKSAVPGVNRNVLHKIKVKYPDDTLVQESIAEKLLCYDKLIDINHRRIQLLEESARLLFREWFVYFRFPGYEKVKMVDLNGRKVPAEWDYLPMTKIKLFKKAPLGVPVFTDIRLYCQTSEIDGTSITGHGEEVDYENRPSRADIKPRINTIYFAKMKDTDKVLYFNKGNSDLLEKILLSTGMTGFTTDEKYLGYLFSLLTSYEFIQYKNNYASGATQVSLNDGSLKKIKVIFPTIGLVERYSEIVNPFLEECSYLRSQNQKLAQARDLLLPRLMSGAIEV